MAFKPLIVLCLGNILSVKLINAHIPLEMPLNNPSFDPNFYEEALDPDLCEEQLSYIRLNNTMLYMEFLEAGLRFPRSLTMGNLNDMGNYRQCLRINELYQDSYIEGKYCQLAVPLDQTIQLPDLPQLPVLPELPELPESPGLNMRKIRMEEHLLMRLREAKDNRVPIDALHGLHNTAALQRSAESEAFGNVALSLAICVPKVCTVDQAMRGLLFNVSAAGFQYTETFCRLNNDKPWVPADYIAIVIFSILGLLTILSTGYDIYNTVILRKDAKNLSPVYRSFSVYLNTRRLTTFTSNPGALECVDGLRALAMGWVIIGHTFTTLPPIMNGFDALNWQTSFRSIWITAAPISVDTFFMISGLLLVYTTAGKITGSKLIKNIHLFYLNRILRMFPLLAALILLQVSVFHKIVDGPNWNGVAGMTDNCRRNWWVTLLYVQNFVGSQFMCQGHTWYLAIDMQLHILSPIILYFALSKNKRTGWIAVIGALAAIMVGSTIYNFLMEFSSSAIQPGRPLEITRYMRYYYINTLARASPFCVGMVYGYLLHICRGSKIRLSKPAVFLHWVWASALCILALYACEPMKDVNWDNQTVDSLVNSFHRPIWAAGLGWIIFACAHGYGGPINWLLSLRIWKLPSRVSYAMYLFHFPLFYVISGTALAPVYFTELFAIYEFLSRLVISFTVGFVLTLLIDSPFSTLFKLLLGGGPKRPEKPTLPTIDNSKL